eukprot:2976985-Pyramimonas_sp.AAC.1
MLKSEMKLKFFHPLREKPDLSDGNAKERLLCARERKRRGPSQWSQYIHACMGIKVFQVLPIARCRNVASKRKVRGACRKRERDFSVGRVKPNNRKVRGLAQVEDRADAIQRQASGQRRALMWLGPRV